MGRCAAIVLCGAHHGGAAISSPSALPRAIHIFHRPQQCSNNVGRPVCALQGARADCGRRAAGRAAAGQSDLRHSQRGQGLAGPWRGGAARGGAMHTHCMLLRDSCSPRPSRPSHACRFTTATSCGYCWSARRSVLPAAGHRCCRRLALFPTCLASIPLCPAPTRSRHCPPLPCCS